MARVTWDEGYFYDRKDCQAGYTCDSLPCDGEVIGTTAPLNGDPQLIVATADGGVVLLDASQVKRV